MKYFDFVLPREMQISSPDKFKIFLPMYEGFNIIKVQVYFNFLEAIFLPSSCQYNNNDYIFEVPSQTEITANIGDEIS
ncbi:MAG: hypothetical protein AAF518_20405, partial [Spirochaetota bacterium]